MAALNYYVGIKRGGDNTTFSAVSGTSSAGTAVDVEVRMQMNDGTNAIGLNRKDVNVALCTLLSYINDGGTNHAGTNLPPL